MHPTQNQSPTPVTPAVTLRSAARYLEQHGWIQGRYYADATPGTLPAACTLGAIGIAVYGKVTEVPPAEYHRPEFPQFQAAVAALVEYLVQSPKYDLDEQYLISLWNDRSGRLAARVGSALLAAADDWDTDHCVVTP
jgi:hypothetical protein